MPAILTVDDSRAVRTIVGKQVKELEVQREDIDTALGELRKGIVWLEGLVDQTGPSEEGKRQAAAYEAVARRQLDEV